MKLSLGREEKLNQPEHKDEAVYIEQRQTQSVSYKKYQLDISVP